MYNILHYICLMNDKAKKLIDLHSKSWLADKLGVTRPTLDKRLELDNWKKSELQMLILLSK